MVHSWDKPESPWVVALDKLAVEVAGSRPNQASAVHTAAVRTAWAIRMAAAAS